MAEDSLQQRLEIGVGFTIALFIDGLAFGDSPLLAVAKIGILAASIISGVVGYVILRSTPPAAEEQETVTAGKIKQQEESTIFRVGLTPVRPMCQYHEEIHASPEWV